jgi:diguanylate cyclase (GGDEF)-like protein
MAVPPTAVRASTPDSGGLTPREGARRLRPPITWPSAAVAAVAAAVLLLCTAAAQASALPILTFRLGAFMAGAVLLSVVLGMVVQEQRTSAQRVRWNLELDRRLIEATRELQVRVEELAAYAAMARQQRVADGVADVVRSHGPLPGEAGPIRLGPAGRPTGIVKSGRTRVRPDQPAAEGPAKRPAVPPSARLHEDVQRVIRTYPLPTLYPWKQFERFIGDESTRCRSLLLMFSIIEIRMEHYVATGADVHDRDLAGRRVVDLLRTSLRRVDILSSNGAGRFAVLLPRVAKVQALEKARELVTRVETDDVATGLLRCDRLALTAGVVSFPDDGEGAAELLAAIETEVMRAHRSGRQCWER